MVAVYFMQNVLCTGTHAVKIYEEISTIEEAIKIVRAKEKQSIKVGKLPYICDIARDKYNRITETNIRFID